MFGKITVLERSESKRKRGDRMVVEWKCKCECGNIVYRTTDQLTNEKNRMCADCAHQNSVKQAFKSAGFEQGTQVTKISEMKMTSANTSGCRGVYWHKKQQKWVARLKFKGKLMNFGSFFDFDDAVNARKNAEQKYFGAFLTEINAQDDACEGIVIRSI